MSRRLQLGLRSKTSTTTKTATARGRRLEDVACGRMLKRVGRGLWPKATGQQLWGSLRLQLAAGLRPPHPLSDGSEFRRQIQLAAKLLVLIFAPIHWPLLDL